MDVPRLHAARRRRIRRAAYISIALIVVVLTTAEISRLEPAAPWVDRSSVVLGKVERGLMLRQVRGPGRLVPEDILWIAAATDGRVERVPVLPGIAVSEDTVLLELSNPQLELEALNAQWAAKSAEAEFTSQKANLQNQLLAMEAAMARLEADHQEAALQRDVDEQLFKDGLISEQKVKLSQARVEQLGKLIAIEMQRLEINRNSQQAHLAVQEATVEPARALHQLKLKQVESLKVTAGTEGVLEQLDVQVGQRVTPGTTLAKVTNPRRLKAVLRIPETQARDVLRGQKATIDTRSAEVEGRVVRIDPAVVEGTVTGDVSLNGALPMGARPDLSVDGTIEIERLDDVLYVGRPVYGQAHSTVGLFKVVEDGTHAVSVRVSLGRSSVNTIEIVDGLHVGDEVILSDMNQWDTFDRIRLR